MPPVDVPSLPVVEPRAGWRGQFFHSEHMTFAYYDIEAGADVHIHHHDEEEVWHVLDGELELSLSGAVHRLGPGQAAIVPGGERHGVRALAATRVIVVDYPVRASVGAADTGVPPAPAAL